MEAFNNRPLDDLGLELELATEQQRQRAVRSIVSAFKTGIPFLKFGEGENALVLAYRRKNEEIDDPDCDETFIATSSAVFKRCLKLSAGKTTYTYLGFAPLIDDYLDDALAATFDALDPVAIEALPIDAAFQAVQWQSTAQGRQSVPGRG